MRENRDIEGLRRFSTSWASLDLRRSAVRALVELGEPVPEPFLRDLGSNDPAMRALAVQSISLIYYDDERAFAPLIRALGDEHEIVQYTAYNILVEMGDSVVQHLIEALGEENPRIRSKAVELLTEIGDVRAVEPLISLCRTDNAVEVQIWAVKALTAIGGEIEDKNLRMRIAQVIGEIGDSRIPQSELKAVEERQPGSLGKIAQRAVEKIQKSG